MVSTPTMIVPICVLTFAAGATCFSETFRHTSLEVGSIWVKAMSTLTSRAVAMVTTMPDVYDPVTYFKLAVVAGLTYFWWATFLRPLNRVRKLGDLGYLPQGSFTARETANMVMKGRKVGNVPPPYPNGWFGLMEGFLLKKGEAQSVSCLGKCWS